MKKKKKKHWNKLKTLLFSYKLAPKWEKNTKTEGKTPKKLNLNSFAGQMSTVELDGEKTL